MKQNPRVLLPVFWQSLFLHLHQSFKKMRKNNRKHTLLYHVLTVCETKTKLTRGFGDLLSKSLLGIRQERSQLLEHLLTLVDCCRFLPIIFKKFHLGFHLFRVNSSTNDCMSWFIGKFGEQKQIHFPFHTNFT